jgi:Fe-S cluster assembly scaffold protein SufB
MGARKIAKELGERFFAGNPCKYGHSGKRYAADGKCVECGAIRGALKWKNDPEYVRSTVKRWEANNPDKKGLLFSLWREKNADYDRKRCLAWQKSNKAKTVAGIAKRKAAKLKRTPAWADLEAIGRVYLECESRKKDTSTPYVVDHIIPLQGKRVSGLHVAENLQIITELENRKKGNKW